MKNLELLVLIISAAFTTLVYWLILSLVLNVIGIIWLSGLKLSAALICTWADYLGMKGGE